MNRIMTPICWLRGHDWWEAEEDCYSGLFRMTTVHTVRCRRCLKLKAEFLKLKPHAIDTLTNSSDPLAYELALETVLNFLVLLGGLVFVVGLILFVVWRLR
jgi:hypothetical protein